MRWTGFRYYLPFTVWVAWVVYLSFSPLKGWPKPGLFEQLFLDKLIHLFMYGTMSFLLLWGYRKCRRAHIEANQAWLRVAFCAFIGLVIEILQPVLTLYRTHELLDMLANVVGAALGYGLFWKTSESVRAELRHPPGT
ncbi:MAG: VanZ family protein [Chitinophagales bacterium]|nr:VanZ family protein [Chitinophagales bacterium]MDW8427772.1 VanZ family protein [Chitinophagales bacterium]